MFWILCAAMLALVAVAILLPFLRRAAVAEPAAAYDLRVYRDQLREVERDVARGVLAEEEAGRLRTEIGRKVLEADRALAAAGGAGPRGPRGLVPGVLLVLLLGGSVALYLLRLGAPGMEDEPLARRFATAQAKYDARPAQAQAEKDAKPVARPAPDADYAALIQKLRDAVATRPEDQQGLMLLAEHEARLGNLTAARAAQEKLVALRGDKASAQDHERLAALMIEAAGGIVTREAEAEIGRALKLDPANGQALFMQGLLFAQNDRPDRTFPIWARLLETSPPDAPWLGPIRQSIETLAWLAGQPNYTPPGAPGMPGPDAAAMAAAGDMDPAARQQMIAGMVQKLEDRMAAQGGTPEEWARLISSHAVLGNIDHARQLWTEAQARFEDAPEALATVRAGAAKAGLVEGEAGAGTGPAAALPGPDAGAVAAAGQMSDADRQKMVSGMVDRLDQRLKDQGGSAAEWARLVNARKVQGQMDQARDALARGRAALAGDAAGVAALNAAAAEAGLE